MPLEENRYDLVTVQECRTADGWTPIRIPSASTQDRVYTVLTNPWHQVREFICQCEGYQYRGYCRHQLDALYEVCGWCEVIDGQYVDKKQTNEEKLNKICPICKGPTRWVMEIVDGTKSE